ncbi:MAG: flavodoxin family protein [Proteobacteria bacterium]|nr:flavodoxin family protein [Pseudomonadota bacterium]
MNIIALYGSPRKKGNSAVLTNAFLSKAEELGAKTSRFSLNAMNFKGCQACMGCKTKKDHCILKDDLSQVLDTIHDSDVLVLATPVYFGDMTAQMKMFFDRTYSFFVPDFMTNPKPSRLKPGKQAVFIQTQGQDDPSFFNDIYPKYEFFLNAMGFKNNILIRACGVDEPGEIEKNDLIMAQAVDAAQKVMG